MVYIAHLRSGNHDIQTVREHLLEVKQLAESFGEKLGVKHLAGLAGLLHDMGKYTDAFKNYLVEAVNNPDNPPKKGSVDHSTAGGKFLYEEFHHSGLYPAILAEVVGNAILSHHSYLQDFINPDLESNYLKRVRDKELDEFSMVKERFYKDVMNQESFKAYVGLALDELETFLNRDSPCKMEVKLMLLTKYIFSALIDADRTNTRLFEEGNNVDVSTENTPFEDYYAKLLKQLQLYDQSPLAHHPINQLRVKMSEQCDKFAEKPSGIYTLSIPTGGGKTLASLRYALKHANLHNKKHIIYVVPYTTIIEQNAEIIRGIIKDDENLLEHHSNVTLEEERYDSAIDTGTIEQKLRLAKDNWDQPIIMTTMVQFLNVFYAKGSRNIRRLHNLSEAVIIFDEVQKVPVNCVSLFNDALNFLKFYGNSSMLLCTATQPALDYVEKRLAINEHPEIIENLDEVIDAFKRVEVIDEATNQTIKNDQLVQRIKQQMESVSSLLVILNTKAVVKDLFSKLEEKELNASIFHLSTSMCASHRKEMLKEITRLLQEKKRVICVSTQLIEAGVDVSFDCVIRSLAGLDSIAQAAGRCNRHGEAELRQVYVIDHGSEELSKLKEISYGKQLSKRILLDLKRDCTAYGGHLLSTQAMNKYFKEFYDHFESQLDYFVPKAKQNMTDLLSASNSSYHQAYVQRHKKQLGLCIRNSYGTAAKYFKVIDDVATPVIVPYGEGRDIIAELNGQFSIQQLSKLLRKAQQYTVNVFAHEKEELSKQGGLVSYLDGKVLVLKESAYNETYGVDVKNESKLEFQMF
ncbi:hypothetical protein A374_15728 [Fictibacillus macauensis ZFHKF-1]|uniref:Metal dependent phosphohydrolase n=1 Tax=Fictibacillus macauensis ZFHKF-1 TaxID=1196324 RepID=I8UBD1_9BACL|nr:CRISPR-associated helicase/endonuclease Cas3 [Fictibacillus macauensis]EIT84250.1 hypothetical protein A374_15728 [Fictibacillus macauensis ZFHKF-1]